MSSSVLPKLHRPSLEHVAHKRHVLTLEERIAVLKYLEEHPKASISEVCSRFASNPRTVRRIQDKRDTLLTLSAGDKRLSRTRLTKGTCLPVEACVLKWMDLALFAKFSITNHSLQSRAKFFFSLVKSYLPKVSPLSASNGWINRFKVRNAIDLKELNKLSLECFALELAPFRNNLHPTLQQYSTHDIFTLTTTVVFSSFIPTINHPTPKTSDKFNSPVHLSLYLCTNATGSKMIPPSVVTSYEVTKNHPNVTVNLIPSSTGNFSSQSFKSWLDYFNDHLNKCRRVLLLLDHSFLKVCTELSAIEMYPNIEFKFLPQFHSNQLQPFNFGIVGCFKFYYRSGLIGEVIDRKEYPTEEDFSSASISDYQALKLIDDAWSQVPASIVQLAWNSTELLPSSQVFEISSDSLNFPDPFCKILDSYPYLYSIVRNYDEVDQIHVNHDGQFPTEFEVQIVEEVVACYLESHPSPEQKSELTLDPIEIKQEFTKHLYPTEESQLVESTEFINFSFEDLTYLDHSLAQFQEFRDPVSGPLPTSFSIAPCSNFCPTDSNLLSPELVTPYFMDVNPYSTYPNLPSSDQIQKVDLLLQLLRGHLSSSFGAPSDITAALDFVSQYVHRFDDPPS